MSTRPAQVLGIAGGTLNVGAPADVTIFDAEKSWTLDATQLASKSKNTPFDGCELLGEVRATIIDGKMIYRSEL